ncbi:DUF4405 domain-containing protein [Spirosoma endbachense]|uniref:DUF4405 domain-containing protein n=1 Tax=Spirosoma endbachense TaxID=2666025 RepID=A0A6P1W8K2_9BACT|nr:DUF4405 domain-containing protein [Spirosoma endbachense]QHW00889.1 DUF4405 domain-containing protein [Spirosoma endbachense]
MKSKNLVSLSVAVVFFVLATTGLLIYFGQGTHPVEHTHAWFGILFVTAAVFHIVNNWSSITGYTKDRRTGGIRREFVIPAVIASVFAVGISADFPVFDKLANAGKNLFRGDKPKSGGPLSQAAIDSIARSTEVAFTQAYSTGDTAALAKVLAKKAPTRTEAGEIVSGLDQSSKPKPTDSLQTTVDRAESIDDNIIVVYGTLTNSVKPEKLFYTHVLKRNDTGWQIAAIQTSYSANVRTEKVTLAN